MISAITSSTTLRVLEKGALNTATPRRVAAARSIWLVPMQNAPTASRRGALSSTTSVTRVRDRMPSRSIVAMRSTSWLSSKAPGNVSTSKPAAVEPCRRARVDVLQQDGPAAGGTLRPLRLLLVHVGSGYFRGQDGTLARARHPLRPIGQSADQSDERRGSLRSHQIRGFA